MPETERQKATRRVTEVLSKAGMKAFMERAQEAESALHAAIERATKAEARAEDLQRWLGDVGGILSVSGIECGADHATGVNKLANERDEARAQLAARAGCEVCGCGCRTLAAPAPKPREEATYRCGNENACLGCPDCQPIRDRLVAAANEPPEPDAGEKAPREVWLSVMVKSGNPANVFRTKDHADDYDRTSSITRVAGPYVLAAAGPSDEETARAWLYARLVGSSADLFTPALAAEFARVRAEGKADGWRAGCLECATEARGLLIRGASFRIVDALRALAEKGGNRGA
jgi:hypothetical protein